MGSGLLLHYLYITKNVIKIRRRSESVWENVMSGISNTRGSNPFSEYQVIIFGPQLSNLSYQ